MENDKETERQASDMGTYIEKLIVTNPLREPTIRSAIKALNLPPGSRGLDAGCGIGMQTMLLAEAVGPTGHVTGLDLSPALLHHAKAITQKSSLSERISFQEGDVNKLPFNDNTFDWTWSADCAGYAPMEPLPVLKEFIRVVKPSGTVAILAWSFEKLLPGYPLLEARLNATSSGISPFVKGKKPELHFLRALGWFRKAGLLEPKTSTFVDDVFSPLTDDLRNALIALFHMRWMNVEAELTQEDWAEYKRLCLPESPDFIVNHPDYYAFFTYSMFHGKVPQ